MTSTFLQSIIRGIEPNKVDYGPNKVNEGPNKVDEGPNKVNEGPNNQFRYQ